MLPGVSAGQSYLFIEGNLLHERASHLSQVGCTSSKRSGTAQGKVIQEAIPAARMSAYIADLGKTFEVL